MTMQIAQGCVGPCMAFEAWYEHVKWYYVVYGVQCVSSAASARSVLRSGVRVMLSTRTRSVWEHGTRANGRRALWDVIEVEDCKSV